MKSVVNDFINLARKDTAVFDALVSKIESMTESFRDMSQDGCGVIWYGDDKWGITYQYNNPFHIEYCESDIRIYRPGWGE